MSHTPIYDDLREVRPGERTTPLAAAAQSTVRLDISQVETGKVNVLAGRQGLGGRHRRSA